jgi:hypothetical protein
MGYVKRIVFEGILHYNRGRDYSEWEQRMVQNLGPEVRCFLRDAFQWAIIYSQKHLGTIEGKLNCWDVMRCGNRPDNGKRPRKRCPACNESLLNGIHGGMNGGRACWAINGTLCGGTRQKRFDKKQNMCRSCTFFQNVQREESADHILGLDFLRMLMEYD